MAGHALPEPILEEPHVGEATPVLERLAFVFSLRVIGPGHDGGLVIRNDFDVFIDDQTGLLIGVFEVFEELGFVFDGAVVIGVNKG